MPREALLPYGRFNVAIAAIQPGWLGAPWVGAIYPLEDYLPLDPNNQVATKVIINEMNALRQQQRAGTSAPQGKMLRLDPETGFNWVGQFRNNSLSSRQEFNGPRPAHILFVYHNGQTYCPLDDAAADVAWEALKRRIQSES